MIKHIQIKDYKCLHDENLEIKPFTIVTGVNSAGKSSLIQSVLLPVRRIGKKWANFTGYYCESDIRYD